MKKKEESKKRERKKEDVVAAVAIYPAKFQLCFLEVRKKVRNIKSCVWTRCSTQEYVAHNYILHKVLKYESRKKAPRLWTMPNNYRLNRAGLVVS